MWETAQRRSKQQKQQEEDFPSLEANSDPRSAPQQHNIVDRIRLEERRKKE